MIPLFDESYSDVVNIVEIERRRKMFHWFINGLDRHGLEWWMYKHLTPDWVTQHYNVEI